MTCGQGEGSSSCLCVCFFLQGLNLLIPIVDQIKYVQSLKENAIDIPSQSAITEGKYRLPVDCDSTFPF